MTGPRLLIALLVANLFATLWVYRGMERLVERVDRLQCGPAAVATAGTTQIAGRPLPAEPQTSRAAPVHSPAAVRPADMAGSTEAVLSPPPEVQPDAAAEVDDLAVIKQQFVTQYNDSAWTVQVHQTLQDVAGATARYAGISRDLVECKEKVCKLALGYSDATDFNAFIDDLTMALKGELAATIYFDEPTTLGGYSTVDVYLVRD